MGANSLMYVSSETKHQRMYWNYWKLSILSKAYWRVAFSYNAIHWQPFPALCHYVWCMLHSNLKITTSRYWLSQCIPLLILLPKLGWFSRKWASWKTPRGSCTHAHGAVIHHNECDNAKTLKRSLPDCQLLTHCSRTYIMRQFTLWWARVGFFTPNQIIYTTCSASLTPSEELLVSPCVPLSAPAFITGFFLS